MKRSSILSVALGAAAILLAGCVTQHRSTRTAYRPRAFALAVTVDGGLQPTPAQWAAVQAAAVKALAANGSVLVTDLALADMIIRVNFSPDPADPEHSGRAVVLGFRANPRRTLASSPAYSYSGTYNRGMPSSYYHGYDGYYGYNGYDRYSDGYIYDTPTGTFRPIPSSTVGPRRDPPANVDVAPPVFAGTQGHQQGRLSSSDRPMRAPRNIIEPGWRNSSTDYHSSSSSYSSSSSGSSGSSSSYSGPSYSDSSSSSSSVSSPAPSSVGESNGASHTNLP